MATLNAYLFFTGTCADAMKFYKECLGGELEISTIGDSPMSASSPPEAQKDVMHSSLKKDGITIMASDMVDDAGPVVGNTVSLCLSFETKDETKTVFDKLSAGGEVTSPLKSEFFGTFGTCTDKFGVHWMFESDDK